MDCKSCVHYEVCCDEYELEHAEYCNDFKDKSLVLDLPCKVGDVVYALCHANEKLYIREETVHFLEWQNGIHLNKLRIHTQYMIREPSELYYSKEAAEQALKEMK